MLFFQVIQSFHNSRQFTEKRMQMLKANILGENRIPYRAHFINIKNKECFIKSLHIQKYRIS